MLQFTRLRLNGFKSFVDRTELDIGVGLNGIVGPNGCGKSNLVEALRWVMGENSAKRMRGGGMEDVIFNGTSKRTARNIAEVSLLIDNSSRTAPAAYNNSDEIEVVRRIERDHGSLYKINGKSVRARDVQMLFADTVTGANSPALVSQGRVTQIINAKPLARRMILEESAGIAGLYARRHEAELRLKGADANLTRAEDVLGGMETRLNALKRQAKQASRYRNLNAQIRQLELMIFWFEWQSLQNRAQNMQDRFNQAEKIVAEKMGVVTQLTKTQTTQAHDLPTLREAEAKIAAVLQTQKISLQRIDDEQTRHAAMMEETERQITQTDTDEKHENQILEEASQALTKLEEEQSALQKKQDGDAERLEEKHALRDSLEKDVVKLEEKYTVLMQTTAEIKARKQALEQQIEQNKKRALTISERKSEAEAALDKSEDTEKISEKIKVTQTDIQKTEAGIAALNAELEALTGKIEKTRKSHESAQQARSEFKARNAEFTAEINMLKGILQVGSSERHRPVLEKMTAESGFEKALSRAMGDALSASLDADAPRRWLKRASIEHLQDLPENVENILSYVKAPEELKLALSQIGVVENDADGMRLRDQLKPGQTLVSKAGTYWRWDGFFAEADSTDQNTIRLEQKNKLSQLDKKQPAIEKALREAQALCEKLNNQIEADEQKQKTLRESLRQAETLLSQTRQTASDLRQEQALVESERTRLADTVKLLNEDIQTLQEVIKWDQERLLSYESEDNAETKEQTEDIRKSLNEAREQYQEAMRVFDRTQQEQNSRKARLHAIADERINLQNRIIRSKERLKELASRIEELKTKKKDLKAQPQDFASEKEKMLSEISALEEKRNEAAENLALREKEVAETTQALKQAESTLSETREDRARAQATFAEIQDQQTRLRTEIEEKFEMPPENLEEQIVINAKDETPNLDGLKEQKSQLHRERDLIGPVNLRADEEALELEKEVGVLLAERNDLTKAIEELRHGINKINKEARERLIGAFEHVNGHFQHLFSRLFAGGQAHLELVDSDDPLQAGLEIYAQPPGKTLQSLSLLSGGEQTLASIALIFAMFLTNPSPICVLDEIDAPLDDANVDKVCDLLEEIAERGETRFLIITHHRLSMARMDKLYGVTMAERGVSQLVSVDLQQSFSFLEEAA